MQPGRGYLSRWAQGEGSQVMDFKVGDKVKLGEKPGEVRSISEERDFIQVCFDNGSESIFSQRWAALNLQRVDSPGTPVP